MSIDWTKDADWLNFTNVAAQVFFWKDDLVKALNSERLLEGMGVPHNDPGMIMTRKEIKISQRGLEIAQFKYIRALKRVTKSDKITWADKTIFPE